MGFWIFTAMPIVLMAGASIHSGVMAFKLFRSDQPAKIEINMVMARPDVDNVKAYNKAMSRTYLAQCIFCTVFALVFIIFREPPSLLLFAMGLGAIGMGVWVILRFKKIRKKYVVDGTQ